MTKIAETNKAIEAAQQNLMVLPIVQRPQYGTSVILLEDIAKSLAILVDLMRESKDTV